MEREVEEEGSAQKREEKKGRSPSTALNTALRLISMRDHSSKQLREKLSQRGFCRDEVEEALAVLTAKGFLNDLRMGRNLIRYMAERRYFGAYKIRMELSIRLDREYIEELLPEEFENYDFAALAKECVSRPQNRSKSREALIRKLKNQGYSASDIRFAIKELGEPS